MKDFGWMWKLDDKKGIIEHEGKQSLHWGKCVEQKRKEHNNHPI